MMPDRKITKPTIDLVSVKAFETATLAMGCFWGPDALFGSLQGVVRTRVGYAGGSTENPTYGNLADHIETIQVDYDPSKITFNDLLTIFFEHHTPITEPWKRQYMSAVFYQNEEQGRIVDQTIEEVGKQLNKKIFTAVYPFQEFYLAEEFHQKYKLQREPELIGEFRNIYPDFTDFINSTAAARVNAYLYGYGNRQELKTDLGGFGLSPLGQEILLDKTKGLKAGYHCSG